MSGPWIKILCHIEVEDVNDEVNVSKENKWKEQYNPANRDDGEYLDPTSEKKD